MQAYLILYRNNNWIKHCNNIVYNRGEAIHSFNIHFRRLYNHIPELIRPNNQAAMIHYYNTLSPIFRNMLEEKGVNDISTTLQTFLKFE